MSERSEEFFKWLLENGALDEFESALDISNDFSTDNKYRFKAIEKVREFDSNFIKYVEN